jgi:branched-chain amino acid transport system substrate-binding protein
MRKTTLDDTAEDAVVDRARRWRRSAGLIAALALAGLAPLGPARAADDNVLTFGASLSLTGRLATEGRLVKDGYDFIVEQINEKGGVPVGDATFRIELVYYDDESDADTAARLVERLLVEDEVDFLLGPYSSTTTFPASTVAERYEVPMVVAHSAATPVYERGYRYLFGVLPIIDQYFASVLDMAATLEPRPETVALINEDSMAPSLVLESAATSADRLGIEIVYRESYPTGTLDVSSMLAAVREADPDIVLAGGYTADMISLAKQSEEMGVQPKLFGFMLGPSLPGFTDALGEDANYLVEPVEWSKNMAFTDPVLGWSAADYARLFEARMGYDPDHHPPQSSAAVMVYYHALGKAGTTDRQAVRDAIAATDIMTFYGPVRFDEKGRNVAKSMAVIQVQDLKPVPVYPPDIATGELVYPRPAD